ncbi:hypothetical protein E3Q23_00001 [Wallemia mellicola]|nr:hypothetical protein E3Q23_00001 [Wallemia mellicola]
MVDDVLIVGFGAVGVLYGWILEQSKGVRVTAVARSNYQIIQDQGVQLESAKFGKHNWKPYRTLHDTHQAADRDYKYIICTFKHLPDVHPTEEILGPCLHRSNCFVLLQNGLGIEEPLQSVLPNATIISGAIWIGANLRDSRRVIHNDLERLVIGRFKGELRGPNHQPVLSSMPGREADTLVHDLATLLREGGSQTQDVPDIQPFRWKKNLWNATFSTLATLAGEPMSELMRDDNLQFVIPIARRTMLEILFTARAVGISEDDLPAAAVDEQLTITLQQFGSILHADEKRKGENEEAAAGRAGFKPSMLIDYEHSRPMELQCILGSMVQRAREFGLETPRLDLAYSVLSVKQRSFIEKTSSAKPSAEMTDALAQRIARSRFTDSPVPSGDTLEECLRASNVTVIAPDDTLYDTVRQTWNSRIQYSPKFIVQPNSTQEVQHSVRCAATHSNVAVTVKSGGHGYAGYAIGGEDGDLTIDVTNFNNIDVDKESSLVRAGTGNHLWDLYKTIYEDNLVLPGGTCPQVGIGGHASFGGYGPLSRKMGLLLDRIVEAEIVYANGTAANVTQGEDIFFAITGAAPSFAIVTQFTFLAERAPENTVIFSHSLINRTAESAADAFDAFVSFINRNVTNDFSAWITLGPGSFELNGMYFGSQDDFEVIAKPLFEGVKLSSNDSQDVSQTSEFIEMYKQIYGDFSPVAEPKPFYSKSLMINEPLTVDQSLSFFNYLSNSGVQAKNQGYDWYIIVDPYNGVIHEKSTQERSFAHRNTLLTFQFFAEMGESEETLFSLVDGMVDSITELPKAAYPNYVDPRLINWQELYYGPNYLRLQEIKGVVDPNNTYRFPQSTEKGLDITMYMYKNMIAENDDLKALFNHSAQVSNRQSELLAKALLAYAENIEDLTPLLGVVDRITQRHASLGVRAEQYIVVEKYLFDAMKTILKDQLTQSIAEAWYAAYWQLAHIFINAECSLYNKAHWQGFRDFKIVRKSNETDTVVSLYLQPLEQETVLQYSPGQFISIKVHVPSLGIDQIRQFSLSEAPGNDYFRVSVKKEPGEVSNVIHDVLKEDDVVQITCPFGSFTPKDRNGPAVLISAGVGATPVLSMLNTMLEDQNSKQQITWIQVDKTPSSQPFLEYVRTLAKTQGNILKTAFYYTDANAQSESIPHLKGRPGLDKLDRGLLHISNPG